MPQDDDELPDIRSHFARPEFRQMPGIEKIKILDAYPEFQSLPLAEKSKFIQTGLHDVPMQPKGFWESARKTAVGDLMAIPNAILSFPAAVASGKLSETVPRPGQVAKGIAAASAEQAEKAQQSEKLAREQARQGRYGQAALSGIETFGHEVAAGLPIVGPMAAQAAEELTGGDPGAGTVHTAELLGPEALKLVPPVKVGPLIRTFPMPQKVERALTAFENAPQGIDPLTRQPRPRGQLSEGQRLGSIRLQKLERGLYNFAGSERRVTEFFLKQQEDLTRWGRSLFGRTGAAFTPDTVAAGEYLERRLTQRIRDGKQYADRNYDSIRQQTARAQQRVQTGTRTSTVVNAQGQTFQIPVYSVMETPVDMEPMRKALKPLYDDLTALMPEGRRAHSPAYRALEDLMTSDQRYMQAMDFDRSLGAIKALARDGDSPYLTTQSQRVAKNVIAQGEKQLSDALRKVSPRLEQQLERARKAVRTYHDTAELMADLGQEPVGMFKSMTAAGDSNWRLLSQIYREAPKAVEAIGRQYLEGYLEAATKEGGLGADAMMKGWKNLGPRTKLLMFGPQLVPELDDFFLASKKLAPAEGSATAGRLAAFLPYGFAGEFLREILTGHPWLAAGTAAGYVATEHLGPRIMARMLLTPGGASKLTQAMSVSPGSPAFVEAMRVVQARAALARKQEADARKQYRSQPLPPVEEDDTEEQPQAASQPQ